MASYATEWKKKRGKALKDDEETEMLSCQDWDVTYHHGSQKRRSTYRVEVKQSQKDVFKSQIYPPTFLKIIKDLLIN